MNFLFLGIFSGFFLNLFRFLIIKMNSKMAKSGLILCGSHVDATWHSGPRGSATRAHVAPTQLIRIFIIYIVFIMGIQPSVYRKGIQPLKMSPV